MLPHLSDQRRHDGGFQISNIRKLIVLKLSAGNYKLIVIFSCTFFVVVVVCLQAVRLRRPLRAARHLRTSSGTAQQWGECEDVLHHVSQSFVFLNDSHSCVCSWTTRWGRSITSSVSWWTVWSRWTCIAASTSSSWETTVRPPYTLQRFVFPLVRYGHKQTKKQTTWPPQRTQDVFAFSVKIVDDVEEVVRLVWCYKTRRQTFEASLNFPHSSFDFRYREECNWWARS